MGACHAKREVKTPKDEKDWEIEREPAPSK
jgi:hypothetical protein